MSIVRKQKDRYVISIAVFEKVGEKMKAIDILFNEIDRINTQIKNEEDMDRKVAFAFQISKIVEIISDVEALRIQSGNTECI